MKQVFLGVLSVLVLVVTGCGTESESSGGSEPEPTPDTSGGVDIPMCTPDCEGKTCGPDGCGGVCGSCGAGGACTDSGQCICVRSCEGLECGDDGCGGSCGTCEDDETCTGGVCACAPQCNGKQCGDDGCGGSCGTCPAGKSCGDEGKCDCVPDCSGAPCSNDGCGGVCETCTGGAVCDDGSCCTPQCSGKECGTDSCGGVCGTCADDKPYCVNGICEAPCQPQCEGKECGHDGCGGVCGTCGPDAPICVQSQCKSNCTDCSVTGTVYAPEGTIPIAGALVYLTLQEPEAIPTGVFCDVCVDLPFGTPFAETDAHGKFSIDLQTEGEWNLVVQKGTFRRVRTFEVTSGGQTVPKALTTLPSKTDAALGDTIPSMAVVPDSFDNIENTLAKLGLGEVDFGGNLDTGTESFDLIDSYDADTFFSQWDNLKNYQIIFMPCDSDWFHPVLNDVEVQKTLRDWVAAGGKLYVTDWSYDILKSIFPDPLAWKYDDGSLNSADLSGSEGAPYDALAVVKDPGLAEWLSVQGINSFELEANWTIIDYTTAYTAPDVDGVDKTFLPKTWVSAEVPVHGLKSATVSFQWGCGRGMFSTYHTEASGGSELLPQELALGYVVFEVGVCAQGKN